MNDFTNTLNVHSVTYPLEMPPPFFNLKSSVFQISEKLKEAKQWFVIKFDELQKDLLTSK